MFNINPLLLTLILGVLIAIAGGFYIYCRTSLFNDTENFENFGNCGNDYIRTLPTIEEQQKLNDNFLKDYNQFIKEQRKREKNEVPLTWNRNNTIESMKLDPCLANTPGTDRMTCHTAPLWWYPNDKYDPDNFRSVYYGDYFNPVYNFLGNAQEMFWDFRTVRNTFNEI